MADPCRAGLLSGRGVLELRLTTGDATGDTNGIAADEFGVVGGQRTCDRGSWMNHHYLIRHGCREHQW